MVCAQVGGHLMALGMTAILPNTLTLVGPLDQGAVQNMATHLIQQEDTATLSGNVKLLDGLFVHTSGVPNVAQQAALERLAYIADWAKARRVRFDNVTVNVRADQVRWVSPTQVQLNGPDMARYQYHHLVGNPAVSWFGLGVYHAYSFKEVDGRWYIQLDHFIDPLNQDTRLDGAAVPAVIHVKPEFRTNRPPSPGAKRAIEYATQFCGAAPGCGNQGRYHPSYEDFKANGGDCSNFISQVLLAGGFSENRQWAWNSESGKTTTWVNADHLAEYLRRSGRATLYAAGTLPTLLQRDQNGVDPLSRIRLGDLIGYYERGRVVHFAIVVGFDPDGYPLVISHSADRYRVPWDLGWDKNTRFLLCHIHYPSQWDPGVNKDQVSPNNTISPVRTR